MDHEHRLQYHAHSFRLLGYEPCLSAEAVQAIARFEADHGVRLPGAVREFYTYEGDKLRLGCPGRDGWCIVSLDDLLSDIAGLDSWVYSSWRNFYMPGEPADQGEKVALTVPVCILSHLFCNMDYQVDLIPDDPDDPWVEPNMDLDPPGPFSSFVRTLAWDRITPRALHILTGRWSNPDSAVRCGPLHLDFLLEAFEGLPNIRHGPVEPGLFTFGFFRPGRRVEVKASGDPRLALCPAEYRLFADDEEGLLEHYSLLWPCYGGPIVIRLQNGWNDDPARLAALQAKFSIRFPGVPVVDLAPQRRWWQFWK
jgi:hypothetical protein